MKRSFIYSLLAISVPLASVNAEVSSKSMGHRPTELATQLAKLVGPKTLRQFQPSPEDQVKTIKRSFSSTILVWKGDPCDQEVAECNVVASEIAQRAAMANNVHQKALAEYVYALHFDRTLSIDDIRNSIAVLKTDSGKKLAASILSVTEGSALLEILNPSSGFYSNAPQWSLTPYMEEFFDRTVGLPRMKNKAPPPPSRPRAAPK